jgi:ABC-type multidrug transport system fused ATPase/permease subunit
VNLMGRVEFEHVSFAYDDDLMLHDISFVAEPKEVVALVGPSGSGKTTAVSLIPRFYEPTSGRMARAFLKDARSSSWMNRQPRSTTWPSGSYWPLSNA